MTGGRGQEGLLTVNYPSTCSLGRSLGGSLASVSMASLARPPLAISDFHELITLSDDVAVCPGGRANLDLGKPEPWTEKMNRDAIVLRASANAGRKTIKVELKHVKCGFTQSTF